MANTFQGKFPVADTADDGHPGALEVPGTVGIEAGGRIIHEAGATRMGADPKTSVLNEWCQAHEAKNVVVCDAGPFVSNADKNCTWTIMALAWRTASHLADEMQKGNI